MGESYLAGIKWLRHDSPNLVICGLDSELPKIQRELEARGIVVRLLPSKTEYHELPKQVDVPHNALTVDVVHIDDPYGSKAQDLRGKIADLVEAYDGVFGIYYVLLPDAGGLFPDVVLIKRLGTVEEHFATPPLPAISVDSLL